MEPLNEEEFNLTKKPKINKFLIISITAIIIILTIAIIIIVASSSKLNSILKYNEDKEDKETKPLVILPLSGKYTHVICFAHGLGGKPEKYSTLFENLNFKLKNETKIILFRAPTIYLAMLNVSLTAWFDFWIDYETRTFQANVTMLENTKNLFKKYIDEEGKKIGYDKIILGGYSLGGIMTFHTGLTIDKKLGGIFVLNSVLLYQTVLYDDERKNLNMFVAHGENDNVLPVSFQIMSVERIKNFPNLILKYYEGVGHALSNVELNDLAKFINERQNSTLLKY